MRIGIIAMGLESSQDFRFAGVARYAYSLMDALVHLPPNGHEYVFFLLPSFQIPDHWQGVKHVRLVRTWKRYNKWTLLAGGWEARRQGLDFLLSTANTVPLFSSVPTGVFIHDLFPLDHPEWFPENTADVNRRTIPKAVANSRIVFTNSEDTKQAVIRHFHTPPDKICVTPLAGGNAIERVEGANVDWKALQGLGVKSRRFLLTLSTIEPRKNLGRVFEALAKVEGSNEVELVVAGSKGWKYEAALAKIEELGLQKRVTLLGYVPDALLPQLFSACECYLCASISEGFGMPLVEAMTAGCAVLTSDGGALPEVGGDAVRYFDPLSVDSIAAAISDALNHPERREDWSAKSLQQSSKFNWFTTARLTVERIEQLTKQEAGLKLSKAYN